MFFHLLCINLHSLSLKVTSSLKSVHIGSFKDIKTFYECGANTIKYVDKVKKLYFNSYVCIFLVGDVCIFSINIATTSIMTPCG